MWATQTPGLTAKDLPSVDVRQYGAMMDGVSDDTAALVAALASNKNVHIPTGQLNHTGFTLPAGRTMSGNGYGATTLRGGTITCGSDSSLSSMAVVSTGETAIQIANSDGLILDNCAVSFDPAVSSFLGCDIYNSARPKIRDCTFKRGGLQLSRCPDFLIEGNVFDGEYANNNELIHASAKSFGVIMGNTFLNMLDDGIDIFSSGRGDVITGNRFIGCRSAQAIECKVTMSDNPANGSGGTLGFVESTIISNNYFRDFTATTNGFRCAIFAEYVDSRGAPVFSSSEPPRGMVIDGNVIDGMNSADPSPTLLSYSGIVFTGNNSTISNNVIRNIRTHNAGLRAIGIKLADSAGSVCKGMVITGNVIAGIENDCGIQHGSLERSTVSNNIVRTDDVSGLNTKFGVRVTAGAVVRHVNYVCNVWSLNVANSFGLSTVGPTGSFSRCNVALNQILDCGVSIPSAEYLTFLGNTCDFALHSQTLSLGATGTTRKGNRITGNSFLLSDDYAISLTDQSGFIVSQNHFTDANRAIVLFGVMKTGIVSENISDSQVQGGSVITFSGVSGPDQATVADRNNVLL